MLNSASLPAIELVNVNRRFLSPEGKSFATLRDFNMTVARGEFVALVGPTGCGKSTTLNLITGLGKASSGEVRVMGKPVSGIDPRIGFVFQTDALFPWRNVLDNVAAGPLFRGMRRADARVRARPLLERVRLGLVEDGTAIGSAIASCTQRLIERKDSRSRIVVLLTDGDNNAGKVSPLTAAEAAKALGVKVYTIGAGTNGYAPMPIQDMFGRKVYQNVKVDVDEDTLKKIADVTGAKFYRATDTKTLTHIYDQIDQMEKSTVEMKQYQQYQELFPWLLALGLGILALQVVLSQTVGSRLP